MGYIEEFKDLYNSVKNDSLMKNSLRFTVICFIALFLSNIVFYFIDRFDNKPARLFWGFAEHIPSQHDNEIQKDLSFKKVDTTKIEQGLPPRKAQKKETSTVNTIKSKIYNSGKSKNHMVIGTNNGINGDVTISTKPSRHLTKEKLAYFISRNPNRLPVAIELFNPDNESAIYSNEILNGLVNSGFSQPEIIANYDFGIFIGDKDFIKDGKYIISICPQEPNSPF